MNIELFRQDITDTSTIGRLSIDGVFECFILENPLALNPALGPEHIAIPAGTFPLKVRYSERFKRLVLEICDVPGRSDIEIHPGNTSQSTHGCLCPGQQKAPNFVGNSKVASDALYERVAPRILAGETVNIEVINPPEEGQT